MALYSEPKRDSENFNPEIPSPNLSMEKDKDREIVGNREEIPSEEALQAAEATPNLKLEAGMAPEIPAPIKRTPDAQEPLPTLEAQQKALQEILNGNRHIGLGDAHDLQEQVEKFEMPDNSENPELH